MRQTIRHASRQLAPAIVLGLFAGRLLSEQWAFQIGSSPGLVGAALLALLTTLPAIFLLRYAGYDNLEQGWPLLLLLLYIIYPEADPRIILLAVTLTGLVFALHAGLDIAWLSSERIAGLIGGGFLTLYIATLAPDVLAADNGEFQLVAAELGIAHPPGFPLYTMLAHLMTRLPIGINAAAKVNLLSAFTSAATLVLVYLTVEAITGKRLAGLAAAVALGTATTFWAQATTANIRSLTAFFAALAIYALIRYTQPFLDRATSPRTFDSTIHEIESRQQRWLVVFGLAIGFGISHHASLLFMALVFITFVLWVDPTLWRAPRRWAGPLLAALAGLLPLLYLPLRAAGGARGAGDLTTPGGFLDHVLATGFRGDLFAYVEPGVLWARLQVMANVLSFQFSPWLLLGIGFGFILLLQHGGKLALLLAGSFALHTLVTATYRAPQTIEYMLPAYVPAAIALGLTTGWLLSLHIRRPRKPALSGVGQGLAALLVLTAFAQGFAHLPSYIALRQDHTARDYAQAILAGAPPDSVILAHWHWVTPLWYLQRVEGQRPDVAIQYVFPTSDPYPQTWLQRTEQSLNEGRPVVTTYYDDGLFARLPPPEPLGEAFLFRQTARQTVPADFTEVSLTLGEAVQMVGYRLEPAVVATGRTAALTVAWRPTAAVQELIEQEGSVPLTLFAHLVGFDGGLYAHDDLPARPQTQGLTLTRFQLTPRPGSMPGDYNIQMGVYGLQVGPETIPETRQTVTTLTVTPAARPPVTQHPSWRPIADPDDGRRLAGYDWDETLPGRRRLYLHWRTEGGYFSEVRDISGSRMAELPRWTGAWGLRYLFAFPEDRGAHYVPFGQDIVWTGMASGIDEPIAPGQTVRLSPMLRAGSPINRDLIVSVRLIGYAPEGVQWSWSDLDDGVPAMGAIPTLKWITGSEVTDPHWLEVSFEATEGQTVGAILRLYDAFTGRPLPILDERISQEMPWVPLGTTTVSQ